MAKTKTKTSVKKNQIGLDAAKAKRLANGLNTLLANYQVFYMNIRGFHWNIKGEKFFELHIKFEELYNDIILKIDEIAERIVTLGETPHHSYTAFLKNSQIKEHTNISDSKTCMQHIVSDFQVLLEQQRELLEMSGEANDEGTNSTMSDYIREQEKLVWMYNSYLQ
ncbi:MAG: DNA starvation/stationary phase protection protein [Chitinophagales bacterium]|nr:DNA starvation/stationary phase protection protein [Chitinophagaceae bacterium]MCB9064727.1 DNA starvation/stationary phase protection protein [Chitinophagales bacterium]